MMIKDIDSSVMGSWSHDLCSEPIKESLERERESCLLTEQNKSGKAAQSIQEHIKPLPHGFFSILLSHILCLESLVQNTIPGFPHCICEFSGGGGMKNKTGFTTG
jgi:hypothetical protein